MSEGSTTLPLGRLEAFSDGVFAIAITLMVLDLGVGAGAKEHLLDSILDEWPSYLAYVTSFLTIGVVWLQHSAVTAALRGADGSLYRINLLVLLLASFLPFPTKLAAEFLDDEHAEKVAVAFYGIVLMALVLALHWFAHYALRDSRLLREGADLSVVDAEGARRPAYMFYLAGIFVSLFAPMVAVWIYLVTALKRGLPVGALQTLWDRRGRSSN